MRLPRRSTGLRRSAAAAGVVVAVLALGSPATQAAPSAALPTPPRAAPTSPPTPPQGIVIVPEGVTGPLSEQDVTRYAQQLAADPIGLAALRARQALGVPVDSNSNVAVMWFDLTDSPELFDAMLRGVGQPNSVFGHKPNYTLQASGLRYEGNEPLFVRIGKPDGTLLLQVASTNIPSGAHSEQAVLERMAKVLTLLRSSWSQARIQAVLEEWAAALYSDRWTCPERCEALTRGFPPQNKLAIAPYPKAGERKAAAQRIAAVTSRANSLVRAADVQAQIAAAVVAAQNGDPRPLGRLQNEPSTKPLVAQYLKIHSECTAVAVRPLSRPAGASRSGTVLALPRVLADPCGGQGGASGIGEVLTAPVDPATYGGVDFTSLQLRYLSDHPGSGGLQYSYSADPLPPGFQVDPALGVRVVRTTGDDLRTWLVLRPGTFWVNLDPNEPDRIIDPGLGQTNAGRALLQADLQMKRTEGVLLNPDTAFGARYWDALVGAGTSACFSSRVWIVPGDVQVREDGDSFYILKATLDVKTESEHGGSGALACPSAPDPAADARNEAVERTMVLPRIVKAVNTAPEYAPLRRAFLARVVAQWIRDRHQAGQQTSFDKLIDSGDLGRSKLSDGWQPRQVYDAYVRAIHSGEFTFTATMHKGTTTIVTKYVFGGVDLSNLRLGTLSAAQMDQQYPQLPRTVQASLSRSTTGADGSYWLGGTAALPQPGRLSRITATIGRFVQHRAGVLAVILFAVLALVFGFRGGSRRRARPAS